MAYRKPYPCVQLGEYRRRELLSSTARVLWEISSTSKADWRPLTSPCIQGPGQCLQDWSDVLHACISTKAGISSAYLP